MLTFGQADPPWHLGDLLTAYDRNVMMLKSTMANLSATEAVVFFKMMPGYLRGGQGLAGWAVYLQTGNYYHVPPYRLAPELAALESKTGNTTVTAADVDSQWQSSWATIWVDGLGAGWPGDNSGYEMLLSILRPAGASIVWISPPTLPAMTSPVLTFPTGPVTFTTQPMVVRSGNIVRILGSFGGLANLNVQVLSFWPQNWSLADWNTVCNLKATDLVLAPPDLLTTMPLWIGATIPDGRHVSENVSDNKHAAAAKLLILSGGGGNG